MRQTASASRFSPKRVLLALAGVFAVLLAFGLRYYGHYHPFADLVHGASEAALAQSSLQITNAVVTGRTNGRVRWRVKAQGITLSRDRSQVTVRGIHDGVLYADNGQPMFSLAAGQAVYQKPFGAGMFDAPGSGAAGGLLTLGGGIAGRALQQGGPQVQSDVLVWDAAHGEVRSFGSTTAVFPKSAEAISGLKVAASLLVWNTALAALRAPGTVIATFPDGISRVQGDGIVVDTKRGDFSLHNLHGTFQIPTALN